jgi:hypothetical protein
MIFRMSLSKQISFVQRGGSLCLLAAFFCLGGAASVLFAGAQKGVSTPPPASPPAALIAPSAASQKPSAQPAENSAHADPALQQRRQLAEESDQLFKLASELKDEMDKTNKDMLSLSVMRKAEALERAAHAMRVRDRRIR